jgi:hypothetical protein
MTAISLRSPRWCRRRCGTGVTNGEFNCEYNRIRQGQPPSADGLTPFAFTLCSFCPAQSRTSSIAAFEEGAGCGARQWHRVGAPGGAGPYVIGPARPKRQPLVTGDLPWRAADPGFGFANRRRSAGGASRRSIASCERDGKRETGRPGRPNSRPGAMMRDKTRRVWPERCDHAPTASGAPGPGRPPPAPRGQSTAFHGRPENVAIGQHGVALKHQSAYSSRLGRRRIARSPWRRVDSPRRG